MAEVCIKCGAPLVEGMRFCTSCGATLGEPLAPAVPPPSAGVPTPPATPPEVGLNAPPLTQVPAATAPTATSGSPILKIVFAGVALLIFFSLLGIGACVFMVYRIKRSVNRIEKHAQTRLHWPAGTRDLALPPTTPVFSSNPNVATTTPSEVGIPAYAGATALDGGEELLLGTEGFKQYVTDDSIEKVLSFYKDKLGPTAMLQQSGNRAALQLAESDGLATVTITQGANSGKTKITIVSMKK
jgi:hypothetical protein